jgi:hypothetical protein
LIGFRRSIGNKHTFHLGFTKMSARAIAKLSDRKPKEERARPREERKANDVNKDYPPWPHVDYDL